MERGREGGGLATVRLGFLATVRLGLLVAFSYMFTRHAVYICHKHGHLTPIIYYCSMYTQLITVLMSHNSAPSSPCKASASKDYGFRYEQRFQYHSWMTTVYNTNHYSAIKCVASYYFIYYYLLLYHIMYMCIISYEMRFYALSVV